VKIWITGAGGMLGSALLALCQRVGVEAVGTLREQGDVCQLDQLRALGVQIRPTHIVHCAAYTDVDRAEGDLQGVFAVNAAGAANVARVAAERGARLVHLSTDYVFSGTGKEPYSEEDACAPINAYGMSKWEGERRVLEILPSSCILRTSWIFGAKGKNFISSLLTWFQQREELQVVSDQCGKPTYCHDLAQAVLQLLDQEGIFHFANETQKSRYQIALDLLEMAQQMGIPLKCQRVIPVSSAQFPTVAKRPAYSVLGTNKYYAVTAIKPRPCDVVMQEFLKDAFSL